MDLDEMTPGMESAIYCYAMARLHPSNIQE